MKYDIATLKRNVLAVYPFFGGVAASITYKETEDIKTTANNDGILFYNPVYLSGLSPDEQIFAFAHELCHIAFGHTDRSSDKDPEIWRTATDAVINQLLKRDGLKVIPGSVDYPEAIDYDAEQYYEILLQQKLEIQLTDGSIDEKERSTGKKEQDDHPQDESDSDDSNYIDDDSCRSQEDGDEKKQEGDEDLSEENTAPRARIVSDAGNSINRDIRTVPKIGTTLPVIDWRTALRDTINHDVDWSFANALLEDGVVRPALEEQTMPETEIVLDTSWSVDEELLRKFLRECKNILLCSKLRVGCFDTIFYGFHDIQTEQDIDNMVFEGGGGTDFNAAVGAFTLRVDNRIIFTDGKAPMPEIAPEAIWMVYGDEKISPVNGTVIHITPEQWK